jgi:uncharacterized OB-fold protein
MPHPTPESQPYWDGAAEGRLRLQRCAACGKVRHYPRLVCDGCYSLHTEWVDASGFGTVHSWTVAHHPFHPAFKDDLPYTLVIVDLQEGPRTMGRLDPTAQAHLRIGLPVRVTFERNEAGVPLPLFMTAANS